MQLSEIKKQYMPHLLSEVGISGGGYTKWLTNHIANNPLRLAHELSDAFGKNRYWIDVTDDQFKTAVIKSMLELLREQGSSIVEKSLEILRKHEIEWPELDTIEKSLKSI